jgi:hypothetical protein
MIRYAVSEPDLRRRIEAHKNGWFARAAQELERIRKTRARKIEFRPLWREIKDVYILLQHSKCAFCEKRLEGLPLGRVEQDAEHFRPKSVVKPWKVSRSLSAAGVTVTQPAGGTTEPGYAGLAYHPLNYAMACKTCNSALKKNFFPIRGSRKSKGTTIASLAQEQPYLIYPIGIIDEDPETLIEFYGLSPRARAADGFERHRALVTIDIFKLDKGKNRKTLMRGRAELVEKLYFALTLRAKAGTPRERAAFDKAVTRMRREDMEHASCLRCFEALYQHDPKEAADVYAVVKTFLETVSLERLRPSSAPPPPRPRPALYFPRLAHPDDTNE